MGLRLLRWLLRLFLWFLWPTAAEARGSGRGRRTRVGGREGPPPLRAARDALPEHVPHRGRQRDRAVPRRPRVLLLVLLPDHPDPFPPPVVDPARGTHDRRLRRRPPRRGPVEGLRSGPRARP